MVNSKFFDQIIENRNKEGIPDSQDMIGCIINGVI